MQSAIFQKPASTTLIAWVCCAVWPTVRRDTMCRQPSTHVSLLTMTAAYGDLLLHETPIQQHTLTSADLALAVGKQASKHARTQACSRPSFAHARGWQVMRMGAVGRHCAGTLPARRVESSDSPGKQAGSILIWGNDRCDEGDLINTTCSPRPPVG